MDQVFLDAENKAYLRAWHPHIEKHICSRTKMTHVHIEPDPCNWLHMSWLSFTYAFILSYPYKHSKLNSNGKNLSIHVTTEATHELFLNERQKYREGFYICKCLNIWKS